MTNKSPIITFTRHLTCAITTCSLVAGSILAMPATANATTQPGYNGRILYESYQHGNYEIFIMEANGGNQTRLTTNTSSDRYFSFSPDGTQIVFSSNRDGNWEIYTMNADGSNQVNLTQSAGYDIGATWSPDGTKILFESDRDGNSEIYIMNADGSNQVNLTQSAGSDDTSSWSKDGSKVLFESNRDGNWEIYTMNADGSNQVNLTQSPGNDIGAKWSPDGTKILFESGRNSMYRAYVMDSDGSNLVKLTQGIEGDEDYYDWSPDGHQVVIASLQYDSPTTSTLIIINADGSNQQVHDLSSQVAILQGVQWSPDGSQILFEGYLDPAWNNNNVFSFDLVSQSLVMLTSDGESGEGLWYSMQNQPPIALNDLLNTAFDSTGIADVLVNDTDEEPLEGTNLTIKTQPKNGSAEIVNGKVEYTPNTGFYGKDELTYQICDSFLLDQKCAIGVLNITVAAPGAPVVTVTKVGEANFNPETKSYASATTRPTFSGTASPFASIRIEIHSDPIILTTTADAQGNWSVTANQDVPAGTHSVYISATKDGATTELDSFVLSVMEGQTELEIPNTGAMTWPVRMSGLAVSILGLGLAYRQRRQIITDRTH